MKSLQLEKANTKIQLPKVESETEQEDQSSKVSEEGSEAEIFQQRDYPTLDLPFDKIIESSQVTIGLWDVNGL